MDKRKGPEFGVVSEIPDRRRLHVPDIRGAKLAEHTELQGARLAWQRAGQCPCSGINDQTQQPDPECELCHGVGVFYFGPAEQTPSQPYSVPAHLGTFDEVQTAVLAETGAAVIHGVIQRATQQQDLFDRFGNWTRGAMQITVRAENKISYYDRLIALDSVICYAEVVEAGAGGALTLKYRARGVNLLRSLARTWEQGVDFNLSAGRIVWKAGVTPPAAETRVTVHYETHPAWRVIDHPHVLRASQKRRKQPETTPQPLLLQGLVRLEFLPMEGPSGIAG